MVETPLSLNTEFTFYETVNQVCSFFEEHLQFPNELLIAKEEFTGKAGTISENDQNFSNRILNGCHNLE